MKAESGEVEEREEKLSSLSLSFFPASFLTGPLPNERARERASDDLAG